MPTTAGTGSRAKNSYQYVLSPDSPPPEVLLLYYKYKQSDPEMEADHQLELCRGLSLSGRILVATEGINGTLAGTRAACIRYIEEMSAHPIYRMMPDDFKTSAAAGSADPFSGEMFILVVDEIISTNGAFSNIPLSETGQGYLTPSQWRDALAAAGDDTVVIDVRNRTEVALGRFEGALDPFTKSFAEFPKFVEKNTEALRGKRVLMYCTGGVRCEKASAFVRAAGVAREVLHLQGGIHKYLDAFGEDGIWKGRNFVFDRRGTQGGLEPSRFCVGRCVGCGGAWEDLDGSAVCTVCNEPVLACESCQRGPLPEFHCRDHASLRSCVFRDLSRFSSEQLLSQRAELQSLLKDIAKGQQGSHRRKTLRKQLARVDAALEGSAAPPSPSCSPPSSPQPSTTAADGPAAGPTVSAGIDKHRGQVGEHGRCAGVAVARRATVRVQGIFPGDAPAAKRAWPVRVWPLSARPWAFIREICSAGGGSNDGFGVEVDAPIVRDAFGVRLAPGGAPAQTRFRCSVAVTSPAKGRHADQLLKAGGADAPERRGCETALTEAAAAARMIGGCGGADNEAAGGVPNRQEEACGTWSRGGDGEVTLVDVEMLTEVEGQLELHLKWLGFCLVV